MCTHWRWLGKETLRELCEVELFHSLLVLLHPLLPGFFVRLFWFHHFLLERWTLSSLLLEWKKKKDLKWKVEEKVNYWVSIFFPNSIICRPLSLYGRTVVEWWVVRVSALFSSVWIQNLFRVINSIFWVFILIFLRSVPLRAFTFATWIVEFFFVYH